MTGLPSWLVRETERNGRHVHCSIFVGPDADHRGLAGRLILDLDQYADLTTMLGGGRKRVNFDSQPVDGPIQYATVDDFYALGDRERSPELDFGVMWTDKGESWPHWRVSWVERTGEVVAVRLAGGRFAPRVEILGVRPDREAVVETLRGWAEIDASEMTLDWVRARLRAT